MEIIKLGCLIIVALLMINGIPNLSKEISVFISFSCCIVILLYILKMTVPLIEYFKFFSEKIFFDGMDVVVKAVGIGFVTQFVSDVAEDCSSKALANQMVFAGRICILVLSAPLFMEVFKIIERLINFL